MWWVRTVCYPSWAVNGQWGKVGGVKTNFRSESLFPEIRVKTIQPTSPIGNFRHPQRPSSFLSLFRPCSVSMYLFSLVPFYVLALPSASCVRVPSPAQHKPFVSVEIIVFQLPLLTVDPCSLSSLLMLSSKPICPTFRVRRLWGNVSRWVPHWPLTDHEAVINFGYPSNHFLMVETERICNFRFLFGVDVAGHPR